MEAVKKLKYSIVQIISSSVEPPPAQSGEYLISIQIPILVCVCVGGGTFEAAEEGFGVL
jgi:hypothetical protein